MPNYKIVLIKDGFDCVSDSVFIGQCPNQKSSMFEKKVRDFIRSLNE
jgi:hypothetical protein